MFGEDTLKATDWLAIEQAEQEAQADRMVVLSDVWLDKPNTLDHLHTVFAGECWCSPNNLYNVFACGC
jgi:hypothetical protein